MYQMSRMYARVLKYFPASFLSLVSAKIMMATSWVFVEVSDDNLVKFSKNNENENNVKKVYRIPFVFILKSRTILKSKTFECSFIPF